MPYIRPSSHNHHDTIAYGWDEDGAGVHDAGIDAIPTRIILLTGGESHVCCHSKLITSGSAGWFRKRDVRRVECFHVHWILLKIRTSTLPAESGTGRRLSRIPGRDRLARLGIDMPAG
jgi:hypothetical protein